jgi:hypothetical protein
MRQKSYWKWNDNLWQVISQWSAQSLLSTLMMNLITQAGGGKRRFLAAVRLETEKFRVKSTERIWRVKSAVKVKWTRFEHTWVVPWLTLTQDHPHWAAPSGSVQKVLEGKSDAAKVLSLNSEDFATRPSRIWVHQCYLDSNLSEISLCSTFHLQPHHCSMVSDWTRSDRWRRTSHFRPSLSASSNYRVESGKKSSDGELYWFRWWMKIKLAAICFPAVAYFTVRSSF